MSNSSLFLFVIIVNSIMHIFRYFILPIFSKKKTYHISITLTSILLSWLITSILFYFVILVGLKINNYNHLLGRLVSHIVGFSVIPFYTSLIEPFVYLLENKKNRMSLQENWLFEQGYNYKVLQIDSDIKNAYAIGLSKYGKIILIGKPLIEELEEDDIKSILLHEVGHHEKKHLYILFSIIILISSISAVILVFTNSWFENTEFKLINIGLNGAVYGLMIYYAMYFQKSLEYQADLFAAKIIGKNTYCSFLERLKEIKSLENIKNIKSITHPTFSQRIERINEKL